MNRYSAAILAIALGSIGGSAHASTEIFSFSGILQSGTDDQGIFGSPGGNLAGEAFTAEYFIDNTHGVNKTKGYYTYLDAITMGTFTVNGITYTVTRDPPGPPDPGNDARLFNSYYSNGSDVRVNYYASARLGHNYGANPTLVDFMENFYSYSWTGDVSNIQYNERVRFCLHCVVQPGGYVFIPGNTYGVFSLSGATSSTVLNVPFQPVATYVPEPATWAMMLFGFGTVGTMIRRRRPLALLA